MRTTTHPIATALLLGAALLLSGCRHLSGDLKGYEGEVRERFDRCSMVVVAEVMSVGPPPAAWSGSMAFFQPAHYRVVSTLKGSAPGVEIDVTHPVVASSRTTAGAGAPGLSPAMFAPGSRVILFLVSSPGGLTTAGENYGVILATDQNVRVVSRF